MKIETLLQTRPFNGANGLALLLNELRGSPDSIITEDTCKRLGIYSRQAGGTPIPDDLNKALATWHKAASAALPRRGAIGQIGRRLLASLRKPLPVASTPSATPFPAAAKEWLSGTAATISACLAESPEVRRLVAENDPEVMRIESLASDAEQDAVRLETEIGQLHESIREQQALLETLNADENKQEIDALIQIPDGLGASILEERKRLKAQAGRAAK